MALHRFRIFTEQEANRLLPRVADVTQEAAQRLAGFRQQVREHDPEVADRTREALEIWARAILDIGAQPKGIFTVDFRSPDPNVLWCWAPKEDRICHRHFTWESFKDRVPLEHATLAWPCRN